MQASFVSISSLEKSSKPKGFRSSHHKDQLHSSIKVINDSFEEIIDCRLYFPGTVAYCCLWASNKDKYFSGSGSAGGYGYHKTSAALADAIYNLIDSINQETIRLSKSISGVGETAMEEALLAVAYLLEPEGTHRIFRSHA